MRRNEQETFAMYRQICGLRREGIRRKDICELFGCSVSTVDRAIRLCGEKEIRQDSFEEHKAECNAALYSRRKKHFIFEGINTVTALSFR